MQETFIDPDAWDSAIAHTDGPQIVVGGPGSGKTEFVVRRAVHLLADIGVPAEQMLILSFSRRTVADLRLRTERLLDRSTTVIPVATFHSLASRLIETFAGPVLGRESPALLTGPEQVALVRRLLISEVAGNWPVSFRALLPTVSFAREVTDFLLRCREQLIDPSRLRTLTGGRADWRALPAFLERYDAELLTLGRIDYGTLLSVAVDILNDSTVSDRVADQYRYVLVDEYQDTTAAQVALLRALVTRHGNLTVAADPYQSIYSFRGADLRNVARFSEDFGGTAGDEPRRLVLTTSFRVPRRILAAAERITTQGRLPGAAGPVTPAPGDGAVEAYGFTEQTEETEWIASEVQRVHLQDGVPYRSIAVFVRSKRQVLSELSRALERRSIPHTLPDARLVDHPAARLLFDTVIAATSTGPAQTAAVRRLLLGELFRQPLGLVGELIREHIETLLPWATIIRRSVPDGEALAALLDDAAWADQVPAADGFWHWWTALPQLEVLAVDSSRRDERAAWTSLSQVLGRLAERDRSTTLREYLSLAEEERFEATPLLEPSSDDEDRLTLATLHQSKGLQFDIVFIAGAVEGAFPDLRTRESILGARHLSPSLPSDTAGYVRFRLQEEMRLAYTAMCRASHRVVWTCTVGQSEIGPGAPSRFIALAAGTDTVAEALAKPSEGSVPVTPLEAEGWLRRILRDTTAPGDRRLAALSLLVEGDRWGLRPWQEFAGVSTPGPDRGLVSTPIVMSPTRAESYLTCPRRFVFERLLHVADEPSVYASFGSLIHEVLEHAEEDAMRRGEPHADLDDVLAVLEDRWDPAPFGGEPWSGSWRRRAERLLTHLYTFWPGQGVPVALEKPLAIDIDGVRWRGKADRIEDTGQGLVVVDYKTGGTAPSSDDAAVSIQLAFYAMAAMDDPELSRLGRVVDAEMWFPAQTNRKSVAVRRADLDRLDEVLAAMTDAVAGIRSEAWTPVANSYCDRCRVRLVCPLWPEGREAFAS